MRTPELGHMHHVRRTGLVNPTPTSGTGKLLAGTTGYFELGGTDDSISAIQLSWYDATSNATVVWQTSNKSFATVASNSTTIGDWVTEPDVIVGPTGVAAGASMTRLVLNGARRNRLVVTAVADCEIEILGSGVH
jgi:hypothetical protein